MAKGEMEKRVSLTWRQLLLAACAMIACALLFWNSRSQSSSWIYPFFSGAANLGLDLSWRVDISGFADFARIPYGQQMEFRFAAATEPSNLAPYSVLDRGYVYIVWVAQSVLFWLPQIKAVIWFQILFHVASSLWVMSRIDSRRQQIIFLLAYALNPIVLHFVTFAYLYYWQVIPSLAWCCYEVRTDKASMRSLYLLALALAAAFLIRQSTLPVSLLILGLAAWRHRRRAGWVAILGFLVFVVFAKNPSQPWHTAYVGLGAYPNGAGIELSDESGYKLFKETIGIRIDTTPPNGNYYDETVRGQYYAVLKEQLAAYAKDHPVHLVRNAALNTLQAFSVGYPVGHLTLAYVSAVMGLTVLVVLAFRQMYVTIALILAGVAGFVLYYPPIPAYMFGNYLLLVLALAKLGDQIGGFGALDVFGRHLMVRLFRR
jgi:hypothetical protein